MKKLLIALLMLVLCAGNAFAYDVNFSLDGLWDWGTVYDAPVAGVWSPNTVPGMGINPYYGTVSQPLTNGVPSAMDGTEDSYGTLRVNQITQLGGSGSILFDRAASPYELTTFFYGFDDVNIDGTFAFTRLLSNGGHASMYKDYAKNYTPNTPLGPQSVALGGGRYDISGPGAGDGFLTVTDGSMVLDLTPRAIVDPISGATYTLENFFSFQSSSGFGSVLFDVTGGSWASQYDTNTLEYGTDIKLDFASFPNTGGQTAWTVAGTGNARANVVPEPASLLLLGSGLLGFAGIKRKKRA